MEDGGQEVEKCVIPQNLIVKYIEKDLERPEEITLNLLRPTPKPLPRLWFHYSKVLMIDQEIQKPGR